MLSSKYKQQESERRWVDSWQRQETYQFSIESDKPVYSIDTPPPTVSGHLHLGHVYSYTHPDVFARFWRMRGYNVFYPMGYDDNGLPTERLVEKRMGINARQVGRSKFVQTCLQVSDEAEHEYKKLWLRLGLSVDWRYTYRTIGANSQRISQLSFIQLLQDGLAYRKEAPAIWCPECQTSIAQAELNDLDRNSEFLTLAFTLDNSELLPIATTRPELLPACVAVFVHPGDPRYTQLAGHHAYVPMFGQKVPILSDEAADPYKGTGAVMCCTFGDTTDVAWWNKYSLPLVEAINRHGRLTEAASEFADLDLVEARQAIKKTLIERNLLIDLKPSKQSVRVHERCDTPVEYIIAYQWFVRLLDHKAELLQLGQKIDWHPDHMINRYLSWVENLSWDWCISRQRYFGVPFPVWYCNNCGEVIVPDADRLPVDPQVDQPDHACKCGSRDFTPELDVIDTWATSSMTPQIVAQWQAEPTTDHPQLYPKVFPFSLRPQAHDIIRTWAFYTLVKSHYHFDRVPWKNVLISGWGIAGEGMGKISKSRADGSISPSVMIERYSADAVRYWATSTSPGKDAVISEEKVQMGTKLMTKLWNVARFTEPFILDKPLLSSLLDESLPYTPADRWIIASLQQLIVRVTNLLENYDYAAAKSEIECFFWIELADNYLEMCKQRLYGESSPARNAARVTLHRLLLNILKLLAPFLPFITEEIYQNLFAHLGKLGDNSISGEVLVNSIHLTSWPSPDARFEDETALHQGKQLVHIATAVRRYKSEHNLALSTELDYLLLASVSEQFNSDAANHLSTLILNAQPDLKSITRARRIEFVQEFDPAIFDIKASDSLWLSIKE